MAFLLSLLEKMPQVTNFNKVRVVTLVTSGMSYRQVAETLEIPKSTIHNIMKKWRLTESVERQLGTGSHRNSTAEEDQALVNIIRRNPFTSAVEAANISNFPGTARTARRRIKESGIGNHAAAKKIKITHEHKEARIGFALEHIVHGDEFWSRVIFSDEKVFQSAPNGRLRVYRPRNTRYDEPYIQQSHRSGRFSVNMWAWVSAASPGVMVHVENRLTSDVYIRILENIMLPSVGRLFPNNTFIFQHDNCSVHTAHVVRDWIDDHNINVLPWPSRSPDLNPIENMWGLLVRNIEQQHLVFQNREELLTAISNAWRGLPQDYYRNLCLSMPNRLTKVLEKNGAMTKY